MSLFGTSPPASTKQAKAGGLFGDDGDDDVNNNNNGIISPVLRSATSSSGLFADDNDATDSPWAFPTTKKNARRDVVKTLLSGRDVPESYIDAFDAMSAGTGSVSLHNVRQLLSECGIGVAEQKKIIEIVTGGAGPESGNSLERGAANVLIALIGLAQEGEELSLDAVDERRKNLPVPTLLPISRPSTALQQPPRTPTGPPETSIGALQSKMGYSYSDSDPWNSPEVHKGHNHHDNPLNGPTSYPAANGRGNGVGVAPQRTTSTFTTHPEESAETPIASRSNTFEEPTRPSTSESGWGAYPGAAGDGFNPAPGGEGGFGGDAPGAGGSGPPHDLRKAVAANKPVAGGVEELITVNTLEEKEGMFLFQHRNYEVASVRRNSKVIRRYSDFVWLLDCLHKRYPFRQLPLLPPKRVSINGNHIASDNLFIEKRRRGLQRFANALVRHPVLNQEQLVIMFLTVPTELAVWRKQATISVQEEFIGKSLPPGLEDSLPPTLGDLFETVRAGVRRSAEIYINLCGMLERLTKRNVGLAGEYLQLTNALHNLTEVSSSTYSIDTNEVPLLNEGLKATAKHVSIFQSLLEDEARAWDLGVLEDLKRQRDTLVSMREMFDRRDRHAKDNIPQLERRIANNENKLAAIRSRPEGVGRPGEAEKVEDAIVKDKQSIVAQHARGVFIKECIRDEIAFFQHSQYHVSRLHQEWSQERVKYSELGAENWRALSEELEGMPLGD